MGPKAPAMRLVVGILLMLAVCAVPFGIGYLAHAAWDWLRGKSV